MNVGEGACDCFWLEPTGNVRLSLRRFTFAARPDGGIGRGFRDCPNGPRGCDATTYLDVEFPLRYRTDKEGWRVLLTIPREHKPGHRDPRWPKACDACGYEFKSYDEWQVNQSEVYVRGDTGETVAFRGYADESMAGALYDAWWLHGRRTLDEQGQERGYVGPDGIALIAICPNGMAWEVDGPSRANGKTGPGWTRTGDPREPATLSVSPSIVAGEPGAAGTYHGHLTAGKFTAHIG